MTGVDGFKFICCDFWSFLLAHNGPMAPILEETETGCIEPNPVSREAWDFVISCGGVFSHCNDTNTGLEQQLQLLDAIEQSASRGFALICHGADSGQGICMDAALERVSRYAEECHAQTD